MEGFLLIDKIEGITSHDVVNRVRRLTGEKRVGHAGTLDPFATGLLIVGVGRVATREMEKLVGLDKVYEAVFRLGATSDTDDRTGTIDISPLPNGGAIWAAVRDALDSFVGEIDQIPPQYSAIKIEGKKMYASARKGIVVEAKPRRVKIYAISHVHFNDVHGRTSHVARPGLHAGQGLPLQSDQVSVTIHCSTGTYIRAIARDLGEKLGVGGYVQELRRTMIGPFTINEAKTLETLTNEGVEQALIPVSDLLTRL